MESENEMERKSEERVEAGKISMYFFLFYFFFFGFVLICFSFVSYLFGFFQFFGVHTYPSVQWTFICDQFYFCFEPNESYALCAAKFIQQ